MLLTFYNKFLSVCEFCHFEANEIIFKGFIVDQRKIKNLLTLNSSPLFNFDVNCIQRIHGFLFILCQLLEILEGRLILIPWSSVWNYSKFWKLANSDNLNITVSLFVCLFVCLFGVYRPTREFFTHNYYGKLKVMYI